MKAIWTLLGILPIFWTSVPAHAATPARLTAHSGAPTKISANAKAKAKARVKAKARATKPSRPAIFAPGYRPDPVDEKSLDTDVAAARRIVTVKSNDVEARERLARASVVLIDWLLRAEAVGDRDKVQRFTQKLKQDLHDTGWRVQNMSQRGDLLARQATGFLLGRGVLLKQNQEKSCTEFIAAADKLAPAGWHAAQCLIEASPEKAWVQMKRAAERGHAAAQEWMGRRCLGEFGGKEKDFACARAYLTQSASLGRSQAQTLLAFLLITGQGGQVDVARAISLYKLAAEQGDVNAQNNLGEIHEMGRGVTKNLDEAIGWYERAAAGGLGSAQFNAGRLWAVGVGLKADPVKARALLQQADRNGVPQARQVLDWLDQQATSKSGDAPGLKPASTLGGDTAKE